MNAPEGKVMLGEHVVVNASKRQPTLFNACDGGQIMIGSECLLSNSIEIHTTDYHQIERGGIVTNAPLSQLILTGIQKNMLFNETA